MTGNTIMKKNYFSKRILYSFVISLFLVLSTACLAYAENQPQNGEEWNFAAFGSSASIDCNHCDDSSIEGSVRLISERGGGKIVPLATDGLCFYYTSIDPDTTNFRLEATATVNEWTYSNGQEGFGLMAADRVGVHGDTNPFWNNSYMASVTKVIYHWNGRAVSNFGDEINMKLGICAQEKKGVTADNIDTDFTLKDISKFKSSRTPLETSCAELGEGSYNLVGNYTNITPPLGTIAEPLTTFDLAIEKNNNGYYISYTDEDGTTTTKKYYDAEALNVLDPDHVYVGLYASRYADVTFSDISFTTSEAGGSTEPPEMTAVEPQLLVESAATSNKSEYNLSVIGNADGTLSVTRDGGEIFSGSVNAGQKTVIGTELAAGENSFELTMTPDPEYKPSEYEKLSSYDPITLTHTVTYDVYDAETIYAAPDGNSSAAGTRSDPVDIYSAVSRTAPGHTIYLMEGIYQMDRRLVIRESSSGSEESPIRLEADPEANARPVIDFNRNSEGIVLDADYWYAKGFDVTQSKDLKGGFRVCGSNNTLEQINAYRNGDTGIWICSYRDSDSKDEWPTDNLILNCTSTLNADNGMEDADGFAAKTSAGPRNVFDGCIAAYNADDGWDLFAKLENGKVGPIVIKNCVSYKNGYILDKKGNELLVGDGNGYKLGGNGLAGGHSLINSIAFGNRGAGITSNSCPDVIISGCTSYDNEQRNLRLYTGRGKDTDYTVKGMLSYGTVMEDADYISIQGSQDYGKVSDNGNYLYSGGKSTNTAGAAVSDSWFVSLDTYSATHGGITRNADGGIEMHEYLALTSAAAQGTGSEIGGRAAGGNMNGGSAQPQTPAVTEPTNTTISAGTLRVLSDSARTASFVKASAGKKSVTIPASVKIGSKTYKVTKIEPNAFRSTKVKTVIIKTSSLTKKNVKGSLKSSKVKTVKVKVGNKKLNKKYRKTYKKIFTKGNAGRKVNIR